MNEEADFNINAAINIPRIEDEGSLSSRAYKRVTSISSKNTLLLLSRSIGTRVAFWERGATRKGAGERASRLNAHSVLQ